MKETRMLMWAGLVLTAGTIATMVIIERKRNLEPFYHPNDTIGCPKGDYMTKRGCRLCPKFVTRSGKYSRPIPPACMGITVTEDTFDVVQESPNSI